MGDEAGGPLKEAAFDCFKVRVICTRGRQDGLYFPKRIAQRDDWLKAPGVREIWSVSECISKGPSDWISEWRHNDLGLFATPELAASVVPLDERKEFTVLGYKVLDRMSAEGNEVALPDKVPAVSGPEPGFVSLGLDVVGRSGSSFSCSPLSCNGGAATFSINERCLFPTLDEALAGAKEFSKENWEPGPYWVVEVLTLPARESHSFGR